MNEKNMTGETIKPWMRYNCFTCKSTHKIENLHGRKKVQAYNCPGTDSSGEKYDRFFIVGFKGKFMTACYDSFNLDRPVGKITDKKHYTPRYEDMGEIRRLIAAKKSCPMPQQNMVHALTVIQKLKDFNLSPACLATLGA